MSRTRRWMRYVAGLTFVILGFFAVGACGSSGDSDSITLRYAFFAPESTFPAVQMHKWADELKERTDGQVEVDLFFGGTLLDSGDIYDGVKQGTVDVGLDQPAYDTKRFPFSSVIELPVGIESAEVASQTFFDLLTKDTPSEYDGFQIITAFTTEPAYVQTIDP